MTHSPTAGTIREGDHVQVWGNDEVGNAVGVVTADNGTGAVVVHFDKLDDERRIPVDRIHLVHQSYAYRPTRSGTAYLPKDDPRVDMSMETFGKMYPRTSDWPCCDDPDPEDSGAEATPSETITCANCGADWDGEQLAGFQDLSRA